MIGRLQYDPARKRVAFVPDPGQMVAGVQYVFAILPGIQAWDGTPLERPLAWRFRAGLAIEVRLPPPEGPTLRNDIAPMLAAHCTQDGCHGGAQPVMGLDLSSAESIVRTAVGVSSRERPSGPGGAADLTDPQWGALLRVDRGYEAGRGAPEYSYLLYKLLGDGPILGERMPPPQSGPPLPADQVARVSDWIARGAPDD